MGRHSIHLPKLMFNDKVVKKYIDNKSLGKYYLDYNNSIQPQIQEKFYIDFNYWKNNIDQGITYENYRKNINLNKVILNVIKPWFSERGCTEMTNIYENFCSLFLHNDGENTYFWTAKIWKRRGLDKSYLIVIYKIPNTLLHLISLQKENYYRLTQKSRNLEVITNKL